MSKFILLDRDGVINRRIPHGYVTSWRDFHFLPGALDALRLLTTEKYKTLVISNQPAVGKGLMTLDQLAGITALFAQAVKNHGGSIDGVYYCPHRLDDGCDCRKPKPGLLLQARREHKFEFGESYFIGDSEADELAARRTGCHFVLVVDRVRESDDLVPDHRITAPNLLEGVRLVLQAESNSCIR
jgi:D-glycero-D-manno-heptose 1,7-bisphosphate phosphatase